MSNFHTIEGRARAQTIDLTSFNPLAFSGSGKFGDHSVQRGEAQPPRSSGFSFGKIGEAIKSLFKRSVNVPTEEMSPVPVVKRQVDQIAHKMSSLISRLEDLRTRNPPLYAEFKANMGMLGTAYEALSLAPGTPTEMREHIEQMASIAENLGALSDSLAQAVGVGGRLGELSQLMGDIVTATKSDIESRISQLLDTPAPPPPQRQIDDLARAVGGLVNDVEKLKHTAPDTYTALKGCLQELGTAFDELRATPGGHKEMSALVDRLLIAAERLNDFGSELGELRTVGGPLGNLAERMDDLVKSTIGSLNKRTEALLQSTGLNPLSEKAIFHSKTFTTQGAIKIIDAELSKLPSSRSGKENELLGPELRERRQVLQNAKEFLEGRLEQMRNKTNLEPLSKDKCQDLMGSKGPDSGVSFFGAPPVVKQALEHDWSLLPLSHPDIREDGMMELFVGRVFAEAGIELPDDLRSSLLQARLSSLNEQPWKPIEKDIVMQKGGVAMTFKSSITPQSQLGRTFSDLNGGGVVCHMSQSYKHVTTLARSALTAPDGTKLFEGIRHGAIAPYDISASKLKKMDRGALEGMVKDLLPYGRWQVGETGWPDVQKTVDLMLGDKAYMSECAKVMRAQGAYGRAQDVAVSALVKNEDKLKRAMKGEVVEINLNSLGLLTPDNLRAKLLAKGESKAANEKQMMEDQLAAWARLSGDPQPKTLTVKDENGSDVEVKVRINVNAFNFGVNGFSFGLGGPKTPEIDFLTGWKACDANNAKAMASLIGTPEERTDGKFGGQLGEWLKNAPTNTPEDRQKIAHVETLARQIGEIWDSGSYRQAGKEPYKIVSRLAVMTSMIGDDVCWNCKSGKDRTGELDVEARYLAMQIWMNGSVPEPDTERTPQDKQNFFRMAIDGGNLELQNYNTGAPGFKLGGVPALEEAMLLNEKDPHYKYFKGISGFYGS